MRAKKYILIALYLTLLCLGTVGISSAAELQTHKNGIGMEFVLMPAGSFMMGTDPNFEKARSDEMPESLFPFMHVMTALWAVGCLIASAVFRRRRGKAIVSRTPSDAVFHENWCSGRSLRSMLTRIGGARNCLKVYVHGNALVVTPHFPFSLGFLPEIFGLDVRVPLASITEVERVSNLLAGRCLRMSFAEGGPPAMELKLRDESGLLRHLGKTVDCG